MSTKLFSIVAALALFGIAPSQAQEYPSKVITMIVPFAAVDRRIPFARLLSVPMTKALKQQVSRRKCSEAPEGQSPRTGWLRRRLTATRF
jgi:tripartite-type tricarboxylate transporter receptor subunit TctC